MDYLYFKNKKLLKKSPIKDIITEDYHHCKQYVVRKIHHSVKDMYYGLSEKAIQNLLNQDKAHTQRNKRFSDKLE